MPDAAFVVLAARASDSYAADTLTPLTDPLLQLGVLGIFCATLLVTVRVLFKRVTDAHDLVVKTISGDRDAAWADRDKERARAEGYYQDLQALNAKIRDEAVPVLADAASAVRDVMLTKRERDSRGGR